MYSILIVDDELLTVDYLCEDINWSILDIDNIFRAYNGEQALNILNENHIDIVITDINMPGLNGIELAEIVQKKCAYTKTILLSGYSDFEYAKKAVSINVFSYVVKPASYSEVFNTVKLAIEKINEELKKLAYLNDLDEKIKIIKPILKEKLLIKLLKGNIDSKDLSDLMETGFNIVDKEFVLLIVCIDKTNISLMNSNDIKSIKNIISNTLLDRRKKIHFVIFKDRLISILEYNKNEAESDLKIIRKKSELLRVAVYRNLNISISIFWSSIIDYYKNLEVEFKIIDKKIYKTALWQSGILETPKIDTVSKANQLSFSANISPDMRMLLKSGDIEIVNKRLDLIFDEISKNTNILGDVLLGVYHQILGEVINASIENNIAISNWLDFEEEVLYGLKPPFYALDVKDELYKVVLSYLNYYNKQSDNEVNRIIKKVSNYINDKYKENITVDFLAEMVYIHPNYLSRLFKKNTGKSITDYIITTRIKKAKELLCKTNYKVYQIADLVGYESSSHFSNIFKRIEGLSPKEYKKLMGD